MRNDKDIVLDDIRLICALKSIFSVRPILVLSIELKRQERNLSYQRIDAGLKSLRRDEAIRAGRTLNYTYYKITNYQKEQNMSKMFEKAIKAFLDDKAEKDPAFAEKYRSEKKNIADCCKFIIAEVKKSCKGNEAACTDQYVYGLAMHYYDEENIKVPANAPSCRVVVPGDMELSEEDKKEASEEALRRLKEQEVQEQLRKERQKQEARKERQKQEAAAKKAEAERKRREAAIERKRKEWENSDLLFNFDEEDQA